MRARQVWGRVTVLLLAGSLCAGVHADALQELLQVLQPVKSLRAQFTEDTLNAQGVVQQHNEGVLMAREPNRFYWKTAEPFPQEIITDGKTLWAYDPDLQQVAVKPFEENYARTPAMLFAGNAASIATQFTVEKLPGQLQGYRLLPKTGGQDLFESLEMTFSQGSPATMTIRDAMQQTTTIFFSAVEINPALPDAQFHFEPPAGVEVLQAQ